STASSCFSSQSAIRPAVALRRDGREPDTTSTVAGAPGTEVLVVASSAALRSTASATQRATSSSASGSASTTCTGAGWYSATTTCALVPPKPKPETPARARPL